MVYLVFKSAVAPGMMLTYLSQWLSVKSAEAPGMTLSSMNVDLSSLVSRVLRPLA